VGGDRVSKQRTPAKLPFNERIVMSGILRRGQVAAAAMVFAVTGAVAYAQGPHGHHGRHGANVEQVIAQVKDKLALNSSQQVMWDNAIASTKAARETGRAERERIHAAMKAELAKPEPDLAAMASLVDQAQASGHTARIQVRDQWLNLYATFTPTQKQVVRDELTKRMERMEGFRAKMKERFERQG
jgi:Spy/CpxP family protein refolding chaperone